MVAVGVDDFGGRPEVAGRVVETNGTVRCVAKERRREETVKQCEWKTLRPREMEI